MVNEGGAAGDASNLALAQGELARRAKAIDTSQWALPTTCSEWNVRDLLVHVIEGSGMAQRLLDGASAQEARAAFGVEHGADLAAEIDDAFAHELSAFERDGSLKMVVHHPAAGDIPGAALCDFRTGDYLLHSWDLARATAGDERLPDVLVCATWDALQPIAPVIGEIGVFGTGPSGTVPESAPLHARLLDLTGRRP